jgi:hypothetical protein
MQNENTLIELGFSHFPDWDGKETGTKHYRLEINGKTVRAKEWGASAGFPREKTFISAGIVVNEKKGVVDRWRDLCSEGSVSRFLNAL